EPGELRGELPPRLADRDDAGRLVVLPDGDETGAAGGAGEDLLDDPLPLADELGVEIVAEDLVVELLKAGAVGALARKDDDVERRRGPLGAPLSARVTLPGDVPPEEQGGELALERLAERTTHRPVRHRPL